MNPRYIVTYKYWNGTSVEKSCHSMGRFYDDASANRAARERYGKAGYELLGVRKESSFDAARYRLSRIVVRSVRIIAAQFILFLAYIWLGDSAPKLGDMPLSQITLNIILSALLYGSLVLGVIWIYCFLVFGDGPKEDKPA